MLRRQLPGGPVKAQRVCGDAARGREHTNHWSVLTGGQVICFTLRREQRSLVTCPRSHNLGEPRMHLLFLLLGSP